MENIYYGKFIPGNIEQWRMYENEDNIIWLAGDNLDKKFNHFIKYISKNKVINNNILKKFIQDIDDHFGLLCFNKNWIFACVDFTRSYPLFWKKIEGKFLFSPQAINILDKNKDLIDEDQLIAFRMSGYTIDKGSLWKNIRGLNAGEFIFIENEKDYIIQNYFSYRPWKYVNKSYSEFKIQLKYEINKIIKDTISKANGRTIVIPLSAGLDSRLIASGLKHFNYTDVKCFTYGLKDNYESKASKIIANKLGYEWKFVEINQKKAKNFYLSLNYKNFMNNSQDGCATSTIQGLYAINNLLKNNYINIDDVVINGNSGDFISGGHIPKKNILKGKNITLLFDEVFEEHFEKHYSLWQNLKNKKNKNIIKRLLLNQIQNSIEENGIYLNTHGIAETLEYQNRQTKYVINAQRIYEFYNLKWQLPLWNKSFIKFWENVPIDFKKNQKLYKDALLELNMGGVWNEEYNVKNYVSPKWVRVLRVFLKAYFLFYGKNKWHNFEKKYLEYWTDNICGQSMLPYKNIIKSKNISRHYVSWLTIFSEDLMLNSNWQHQDNYKDLEI
ncbi:MAG: hypothetical protein CMJ11_05530 [Pelagibacterales bacterium]|nr:hypothetical protein [Pelagibacterales bacterium]|tara:strand:- start:2165 stop:3832 length:1668 start_codon:yes stop_codon:yes gene_type:complete